VIRFRDVDLIEVAAGGMNDYAANSAVAHEQVRTAANHKEWKIVAPAKPDQFDSAPFRCAVSTQNCAGPPTRNVVCFEKMFVKTDVAPSPTTSFNFLGNDEIGRQDRQLLVDVAGAQA